MRVIYIVWQKFPQPIEKVGYIRGSELIPYDHNWNIRRIPIKCENCDNNDHYELNYFHKKSKLMAFIPLGKCDEVYSITCPVCNKYKLELEDSEYYELKKNNLIHKELYPTP